MLGVLHVLVVVVARSVAVQPHSPVIMLGCAAFIIAAVAQVLGVVPCRILQARLLCLSLLAYLAQRGLLVWCGGPNAERRRVLRLAGVVLGRRGCRVL